MTNVPSRVACKLVSLMGAHNMPGQQNQPTLTSFVWPVVYVCVVETCHLHFWQGDRGVLHATASNTSVELNGMKVSTLNHSGEANPQLVGHESGALPTQL